MKNTFNNILVVRTDRIGDVLLTTPALKALRQRYLSARISVLIAPAMAELLNGNPDINEIIIDDRKGVHRGLFGFVKLILLLAKKKFDLAVVFHTKKRTNALCFFAGIPRRIGYRNNKLGTLLTDQINDDRHLGVKHEAQYCLDLLKHVGVGGGELKIHYRENETSAQWAQEFLQRHDLLESKMRVAIHPGASDPDKMWSISHFAELIGQLKHKYASDFLIVGGPDIRPVAEELASLVETPLTDLVGKTTVSQLASILKRCHLLVSNDSGPVHIADAVEIPVVSIFTRNAPGINPKRWRPLGPKGMVIFPQFQGDKIPQNDTKSGYIEPKSMPTAMVLEAVDSLFKLC